MAKCQECGREMLKAKGCRALKVKFPNDNKLYKRIRFGDAGDWGEDAKEDARCGDCGAKKGGYHHSGCDCERCPKCGGQLITCECWEVK